MATMPPPCTKTRVAAAQKAHKLALTDGSTAAEIQTLKKAEADAHSKHKKWLRANPKASKKAKSVEAPLLWVGDIPTLKDAKAALKNAGPEDNLQLLERAQEMALAMTNLHNGHIILPQKLKLEAFAADTLKKLEGAVKKKAIKKLRSTYLLAMWMQDNSSKAAAGGKKKSVSKKKASAKAPVPALNRAPTWRGSIPSLGKAKAAVKGAGGNVPLTLLDALDISLAEQYRKCKQITIPDGPKLAGFLDETLQALQGARKAKEITRFRRIYILAEWMLNAPSVAHPNLLKHLKETADRSAVDGCPPYVMKDSRGKGKTPVKMGSLLKYVDMNTNVVACAISSPIYAVDCEMVMRVGTDTSGMLARVSVTDVEGGVVYDEFVKPQAPVKDYRTKYSGITREISNAATTTISDVQKFFRGLLAPKGGAAVVLVGHSLRGDLHALKIIYNITVDTAVAFPHKDPSKTNGLKFLTQRHFSKNIQVDSKGHCSIEDARATMNLALLKIDGKKKK